MMRQESLSGILCQWNQLGSPWVNGSEQKLKLLTVSTCKYLFCKVFIYVKVLCMIDICILSEKERFTHWNVTLHYV